MNKYILDDNGEPMLDADGKKMLNPEWVAANPNYTASADESGGNGGYTPDEAAQKWHNQQVAGLKANNGKLLGQATKSRKRAETAEKEVERLEAENASLRERLGSGDGALDPKEKMELETKVSNLERTVENLNGVLTTTKDELHKYKYEGAIDAAMIGVIKPGSEFVAKAALHKLIKENEDGELECFNPDGTPAVNLFTSTPLSVKEFISTEFAKSFPDLCVADSSLPTGPGGKKSGPKADNPFAKDTMNRTVQGTIIKNDPSRAKQLMKAAGYDQTKINRLMGNLA